MQEQDIANILLYDMAQRRVPLELGVDRRLISEMVEGWNQNKYVFPQYNLRLQKRHNKKYDLM